MKEICEIISEWFPNLEIEEQKISTFIDNLGNLEVVEMRPYHEEINSPET